MTQPDRPFPARPAADFAARAATVAALAAILFLAWYLRATLALAFLAVVFAAVFDAVGRPIRRLTGVGQPAGAISGFLALLAIAGLGGWLFAPTFNVQASEFAEQVPTSLDALESRIGSIPDSASMLQDAAGRIASMSMTVAGAMLSAVLVVMAGVYLAAGAERYLRGTLELFPRDRQPGADRVLRRVGRNLHRWLKAKLLTMLAVGSAVAGGAWLIGLPAPLVLGLLSGLLAFVPVIGPIAASVPGIILSIGDGGSSIALTLLLYIAVEQIESNLILPLLEGDATDLPPALLLLGFAVMGTLAGTVGVIIAAPFTVAVFTFVRAVWVDPAEEAAT